MALVAGCAGGRSPVCPGRAGQPAPGGAVELDPIEVQGRPADGALRGFGAGERSAGRSCADSQNADKAPDDWLSDADLQDERDGYRIAITAQNLLDETYVSGYYGLDDCFYGDTRRVTASLGSQR